MEENAYKDLIYSKIFYFCYGGDNLEATWSSYETAVFNYASAMPYARRARFCEFFFSFYKNMPRLKGTYGQRVEAYHLQMKAFEELYLLELSGESVADQVKYLKTKRWASWWINKYKNESPIEVGRSIQTKV